MALELITWNIQWGRARTGRGVLCGDFNCGDDDPLIARLQAPLADGGLPYVDGWPLAHPGRPHAKTVGLFDVEQWKGQQHCFDFFFVSSDLAPGVQSLVVDDQTQASDHVLAARSRCCWSRSRCFGPASGGT